MHYIATSARGTETFVVSSTDNSHTNSHIHAILEHTFFQSWLNRLEPDIHIESLIIQSVDYFGRGVAKRIGFIKFKAVLKDKDGNTYPGIVFLRGETVTILPVLMCEGKLYTLLVEQMRAPAGTKLLELPAGMVDEGMSLQDTVIKELLEETGLIAEEGNGRIIHMTGSEGPIFFSPGASDERGYFFAYTRDVSRELLDKLQGTVTGEHDTDERIKLKVIPLGDLLSTSRDGKTLIAYCLYVFSEWPSVISYGLEN